MKTLYLDCSMGAAGDMLLAALMDLQTDPQQFLTELNQLGIPGVEYSSEIGKRQGICGRQIHVHVFHQQEKPDQAQIKHDQQHHHHHLGDIKTLIQTLELPLAVRNNAQQVYQRIAQAEAAAHGCPVEQVHFHEVGALDAVADVVGVCLAIYHLKAERIVVSPVRLGYGTVQTAHGMLPVPAPATAYLMQNMPCYAGDIEGEMLTPTGAALLAHFATEYGQMPLMQSSQISYGLGSKDFPQANCLRAFYGEVPEQSEQKEQIVELSCNLDDMTAEDIGFCLQVLMENGALDAFTTAIMMKRQRPATMLTCLARPADEQRLAHLMLRHTSSFGIRCSTRQRYTLERQTVLEETPLGKVHIKYGRGFGCAKAKAEYSDLVELAQTHQLSLEKVRHIIQAHICQKEDAQW